MRWPCTFSLIIAIAFYSVALGSALAESARIAVGANFRTAIEVLVQRFGERSGHDLTLSSGATGLLHAQIAQGAPFDVFLAADMQRPLDLIERGLADETSLRVYARGQLIVIAAQSRAEDIATLQQAGALDRIAIANPRTAPYGRAAEQALAAAGVDPTGRLAFMQSVSGVVAAVRSGAAQAGIAARSAVAEGDGLAWHPVPAHLYDPIEQGVVLLNRGRGNIAAQAFLDYLASEDALSTIRGFGYGVD